MTALFDDPVHQAMLATLLGGLFLSIGHVVALGLDSWRRAHHRRRAEEFERTLGEGFFEAVEGDPKAWLSGCRSFPREVVRDFLRTYLRVTDGPYKERVAALYRASGLMEGDLRDSRSRLWHRRMLAVRRLVDVATLAERDVLLERRDDTLMVQLIAARAVARIGDPADLFRLLEHWDPQTRLMEVPVFVLLQALPIDAFQGLMGYWDQLRSDRVRRVLLVAAARRDPSAAGKWLARAAGASTVELRLGAAIAAGALADDASVNTLIALLGDPAWEVRAQAAKQLRPRRSVRALDALERAMRDSSFWTRQNAAASLSTFGADGMARLRKLAEQQEDRFAQDAARQELQRVDLLVHAEVQL